MLLAAQARVVRFHKNRSAFNDFAATFQRFLLEPFHRLTRIKRKVRRENDVRQVKQTTQRMARPRQRFLA